MFETKTHLASKSRFLFLSDSFCINHDLIEKKVGNYSEFKSRISFENEYSDCRLNRQCYLIDEGFVGCIY